MSDYFLIEAKANELQRKKLRDAADGLRQLDGLGQAQALRLSSIIKAISEVDMAYNGLSYLTPYPVDYETLREFLKTYTKKDWKPENNTAVVLQPVVMKPISPELQKEIVAGYKKEDTKNGEEIFGKKPAFKAPKLSAPAAVAAVSAQTNSSVEPDLNLMSRKDLIQLAWSLGYQESDTRGKAVKDVRALIVAKRESAPEPTPPTSAPPVFKKPTSKAFIPPKRFPR